MREAMNIEDEKQPPLNATIFKDCIENSPTNIIIFDIDLKIEYLNPKSMKTLKQLEKFLPVRIDEIIGSKINIFTKPSDEFIQSLKSHNKSPFKINCLLGDEVLNFIMTTIYDENKEYIGSMATWEIITDKELLRKDLGNLSLQLLNSAGSLTKTAGELNLNTIKTQEKASSVSSTTNIVAKGIRAMSSNAEQMNTSIEEIAKNAKEVSNQAKETKYETMKTKESIARLGESSIEIGTFIKVISSIAQQTNLLALNATIEAARAGEAGRGFAVVASEVKELAKQTATATDEITRKVKAIQEDFDVSSEAINNITNSINSLDIVSSSIATSVEEQLAVTQDVSRVIYDANKGISEISVDINHVSEATKSNNNETKDLNSATQNLELLADKLKDLLNLI